MTSFEMTEEELIAERIIYAVSDEGRNFEIRLMIWWTCPVALSGLHGMLPDAGGTDS